MANIISIENLTKSYGDRLLFGDVTLGLQQGDKVGIVARNGVGKSTFLEIIAGTESADSGTVTVRSDLRIGYLPQEPYFAPDATIRSAAIDNNSDPRAQAIVAHRAAIESGDEEAIKEAVHQIDVLNAWDYEDRLLQRLTAFGFKDLDAPVAHLSGGQRKRLALVRLVMSEPELLLLDEPTNHLDIATIEWLENYLRRSKATILMVTHDRYFLDRVCSKIIEIDNATTYEVEGNYSMYLRRRAERIEAMEADVAKARNTLRKEQEWMSRQPQARAGKAKFRIDAFYSLKERARGTRQQGNIRLEGESSRIGSKIFEARDVCKRFGDKVILDDFTYTFARGEKLGIVGVNGVGKSTFIKLLQGLLPIDSGEWQLGETVRFGYYSQDGIAFNSNKKVVDAITELADDIELKEGIHLSPMQYLQRFLFSPKDQQKYIHTLSGGERCRLHLATVLMRQPNFLILDEPTNDLDIITLGILEEYLVNFQGCVIVISHDRYFLDNIVDHLFVMEGDGVVRDFPGNYSDYRAYLDSIEVVEKPTETPSRQEQPRRERPVKMSFKERKEFEALEESLQALNKEKSELEAFFASGEDTDAGTFATRSQRYSEISDIIDEQEMRWLELSEKA
ncbi:MAG: ABC-F family ATP-binding cassette domain-containing protein [Muribaculaceae bacterium]|nr:ABC-F family ATP-binding cassette domain-containing protein [Muribaculaceae bacterium]